MRRSDEQRMGQGQIKIEKARLAELQKLVLDSGSHESFEAGVCAMEAAAWLAKEPHSDSPQCTCPAIAAFMRSWNDSIQDDARRTELLLPLIPLVVGTRGGDRLMVRRSYMAIDWDIRTRAPAWLRLAGLEDHAKALESQPEISTRQALERARSVSAAAWDAARAAARAAAWDAACAGARDAARDAAWDAVSAGARAAAWDAACAAARAAAWDAAFDAARAAAWAAASVAACAAAWDAVSAAASAGARAAACAAARAAAWAKLDPTVRQLQESAQDLVRRMCALTDADIEGWSWDEVAT